MPWHIEQRGDEWCVIKDQDGENEGCHSSEEKAQAQMRALYANEQTRTAEFATFGARYSKLELHSEGKRRTMVGYASAFDVPIPGDNGETIYIDRGAYNKTLKENRANIQVLFHHGMDPSIGLKPLGVPSVMEPDRVGLWTETPLAATDYNRETIIPLLESGALRSMSVSIHPHDRVWNDDHSEVHYRQLALQEFGPTPFPRNLGATAAIHARSPGDLIRELGGSTLSAEQTEASVRDRETIANPDRLIWLMEDERRLEHARSELEATAAFLKRQREAG